MTETIQVLSPHQLFKLNEFYQKEFNGKILVTNIGIHSTGEIRIEYKGRPSGKLNVELIKYEPTQKFERV